MLAGCSRRRMCSVAIYLLAHERTGPELGRLVTAAKPDPDHEAIPGLRSAERVRGLTTSRASGSRGGWGRWPTSRTCPGPARGSRSPRG